MPQGHPRILDLDHGKTLVWHYLTGAFHDNPDSPLLPGLLNVIVAIHLSPLDGNEQRAWFDLTRIIRHSGHLNVEIPFSAHYVECHHQLSERHSVA